MLWRHHACLNTHTSVLSQCAWRCRLALVFQAFLPWPQIQTVLLQPLLEPLVLERGSDNLKSGWKSEQVATQLWWRVCNSKEENNSKYMIHKALENYQQGHIGNCKTSNSAFVYPTTLVRVGQESLPCKSIPSLWDRDIWLQVPTWIESSYCEPKEECSSSTSGMVKNSMD